METTAAWHAARQGRARKERARKGDNLFGGGSALATATVEGIPVTRLSVWPTGAAAPPQSYAVLPPTARADAVDLFDEPDDVEFPEDTNGSAERRGAAESLGEDEFAEAFATGIQWETKDDAPLPMNLHWLQSAESRFEIFFHLPPEAICMGLGERLSGLNLRSQKHTLFNTDDTLHTESTDSMYKSIPFLIVSHQGQCHGLFLDSPARQRWDLDSELDETGHVQLLSRRGWELYCLGPAKLPDIVAAYTHLTGRPTLPPRWALGHHQSRWSYPDQETVVRIAHEFRSRNIPCDAIVLDIDYMDDYRVFTYSKQRFPDFRQLVLDLENNGFKVVTIIDPGVKKESKYFIFNDGKKHDYFCKKGDGKLFVGEVWPGQSVFPDFLREDVRLWWAAQHGFHIDLGVAGIWNDMNEPSLFNSQRPLPADAEELPPDTEQLFMQQTADGKTGHYEVRNLYGSQMSRATHDGLLALRPDERPFVLSRSGYAGIQRYAAVWLGDNHSWWEHLARSIPMLLNMSISGVAFCGVDVGGFSGDCTAELLVRWYALGIFYPYFRNHCSMYGASQEPWVFNENVEDHCKRLIEWRYRLIPHIERLFAEHVRTGAPLLRPLSWHYPDDRFAAEIDDQFLFGEEILVAPIVQRGRTTRSVYLPEGKWHRFEGSEVLDGGRSHQVTFALGEVPAFVKEGTVLPLADSVQHSDQLSQSGITFRCYGYQCRGTYYEDDGKSFDYREGQFNEWRIRVDEGAFLAQPVELGFDAPARQFRLEHQGETRDVELSL